VALAAHHIAATASFSCQRAVKMLLLHKNGDRLQDPAFAALILFRRS